MLCTTGQKKEQRRQEPAYVSVCMCKSNPVQFNVLHSNSTSM